MAGRAQEHNDATFAHWLQLEYLAIARQAKREQAVIYWGEEMGLRNALGESRSRTRRR